MKTKRRFEEDDEGAWRAMLPRWSAPEAPPRLEGRLRSEFIARHRTARLQLWAGRAAMVVLALAVATTVRLGGLARKAVDHAGPGAVSVAAELDLSGFEPVQRLRLARLDEVVTETTLDGFVPLSKMTLTKAEGRP